MVTTARGLVNFTGTGAGQGNYEDGIDIENGAHVTATDDGSIKFTGTASPGVATITSASSSARSSAMVHSPPAPRRRRSPRSTAP